MFTSAVVMIARSCRVWLRAQILSLERNVRQGPIPSGNHGCRHDHIQKGSAVTTIDPAKTHHPSVLETAEHRSAYIQLRIADAITAFAGSMHFVYLHAAIFAAWMLFFEKSPWPTLTLIVSLEAIFLSTFVMIGQNRQAAFQQAKAD